MSRTLDTGAALTQELLVELQAHGVQLDDPALLGARRGGAGPSDHRALTLDGTTLMVPVLSRKAQSSPYRLRILPQRAEGELPRAVLEREATPLAEVELPGAARFYARSTADGIPYSQIALLHGRDVLASTVLQSCVRIAKAEDACQFCAIGDSLRGGRTLLRKSPEQLAEVAAAALALDDVTQVVLTTGTPGTPDRGAAHLAACARAIKAATGLPIQVQCEPPEDLVWYERLREAGADTLGLHLEVVEPEVRARVIPGKARIPLAVYFEAFEGAVAVFGRGQVSSYLIAGLGDAPESLLAMAETLARLGVFPFVVPYVPLAGTPLADRPAPSAEFMQSLYPAVARIVEAHGLRATAMKAGCAKCGACSALSAHERELAS